jgi:putative OPT family oligopeptide transporter
MTIIVGSIVTGIAAIANDNTQDLKVGQLVGATPWKQQLMLLLGVVVSALVIPPVMHLLFDVYGIAGVMPRPGMDASQSLPAPTAVLLAAITTAVFQHALPWQMLLIGASMMILLMMLDRVLHLKRLFNLSVLGVAIGMYLPLSSSFPLFIGGMIAHRVKRTVKGHTNKQQIGTLIACGLVAGSALIDVLLALIFSLTHSQNALALMSSARFEPYRVLLAVITIFILSVWIKNRVSREQ